jgi:hypothetical protein
VSSSIGRYLRRNHLGIVAVFIALGGGAYAASQPGADGDIDACFKKKSGALYVQKKAKCKKGTKAIAWAQQGPQGEPGPAGPAGADGSARAYGRVAADGTLTGSSGNVSISHPQNGVYCIGVDDVNASQASMVTTVDYNGANQQQGTATFNATDNVADDPVSPSGSNVKFAQWDSIPNLCAAGQFEVRVLEQRLDAFTNTFETNAVDATFAFLVP